MTLQKFISENRGMIDGHIARALRCDLIDLPARNDRERRLWVLNDSTLYKLARAAGVRI